jgi:hypothetical protein
LAHTHHYMSICLFAFCPGKGDLLKLKSVCKDKMVRHKNSCHGVLPLLVKYDPKWVSLALKIPTPTLISQLSALWKYVSIDSFLQEGTGYPAPCSMLHAPCFHFSSSSCLWLISSWKKDETLKRRVCFTEYQKHEKN